MILYITSPLHFGKEELGNICTLPGWFTEAENLQTLQYLPGKNP